MKILALSDIHTDLVREEDKNDFFTMLTTFLNAIENVNLVICAGDISPDPMELTSTLKTIGEAISAEYYLFVPGNHDVWEVPEPKNEISRFKYEQQLKDVVETTKFRYLPFNPLCINDKIGVIGSIGWYDYSLRNPEWDEHLSIIDVSYSDKWYAGFVWNDARYANWGMKDEEVVDYLLKQLEIDYNNIQHCPYKIAIFHHIPFKEGVENKRVIKWDYFSAFMGSKRFGEQLLQWGVQLVIHGHAHRPREYKVEATHVYCAPIGYSQEWKTGLEKELAARIKIITFP